MDNLNRVTHELQIDGDKGQVQIADEVIAIIAGMAATEVKGVASMAGNIKNELVSKMGMKTLSKGVKVEVTLEPPVATVEYEGSPLSVEELQKILTEKAGDYQITE